MALIRRWRGLLPLCFGLFIVSPMLVGLMLIVLGIVMLVGKRYSIGISVATPGAQSRDGKDTASTGDHAGEVIELGHAPYEHKEEESSSFFISLQHGQQVTTLWGVDLARVAKHYQLQPGDRARLICQGRKPVTIKRHGRTIKTHRNTWDAEIQSRCYSQ